MDQIWLTFLNGADIEELALEEADVLAAVEDGLRAQGLGETVIEPRVHLDVWLTPYFTLGCFAAMPDLSPAATNVGLTLAAHTLPFDGKFSLF